MSEKQIVQNSLELAQGEEGFNADFSLSSDILSRNGRKVAIFGGVGIEKFSETYEKAVVLARLVSKAGISIITGGGLGIMEAANKGAKSAESTAFSYGLKVRVIEEAMSKNEFMDANCEFTFNTLSIRLLTLISASDAIVFFPGGFGTLEELFSLLVRLKVGMLKKLPIYLFGSKFWNGLMNWLAKTAQNECVIAAEHMNLFKLKDDVDEISNEIIAYCLALK
ncbi:cytokinin riboside 5'-monophosphate phosphoribohydrolase [Alphaproteobacteria bacterium]|nr:cytokinin riboside 5'-monophosphate phosphoribohydrolase [Alphaproteobacteria bacterium]